MWPTLDKHLARSTELENLLADPAVVVDPARYGPLAKEHAALGKLVKPYHEFQQVRAERAIPAGAAVLFHLHNHGANSWALVEVSAGGG